MRIEPKIFSITVPGLRLYQFSDPIVQYSDLIYQFKTKPNNGFSSSWRKIRFNEAQRIVQQT